MSIPVPELARRLCIRNHPHLGTTFQPVPCGEHLRQGNMYAHLTTEPGKHTFEVIRDARDEFLGETNIDGLRAAVADAEQQGLKVHVGLQESCEANIEAGPVLVAR
jgi:hypothetical protein